MKKVRKILRDNNTEIMSIWQKKVRKKVSASKEVSKIALVNHLPNIIDDIADIMLRFDNIEDVNEDEKYNEIIKNSKKHGKHRSSTANYTVGQIIQEYIIFHHTLSEYLKLKNVYNEKVSDLLKYVIETSILQSVGTFSHSIQGMQEKLIGTLAHDIRNPLSAAHTSLKMVELYEDDEHSNTMLTIAQRSVDTALSLIEGLMDGISVKAGKGMLLNFEHTNILQDIKRVYSESKDIYSNDIILDCSANEIIGVFDKTAVKRLLVNIIGNAVKHGSLKKPITIYVKDNLEEVELRVHNHGDPISEEQQSTIFQFLGHDNKDLTSIGKSWGMGLSLAKMVAHAHGGDIKLTSSKKSGTLFIVTLYKHFNKLGKKRAKLILADEAE